MKYKFNENAFDETSFDLLKLDQIKEKLQALHKAMTELRDVAGYKFDAFDDDFKRNFESFDYELLYYIHPDDWQEN